MWSNKQSSNKRSLWIVCILLLGVVVAVQIAFTRYTPSLRPSWESKTPPRMRTGLSTPESRETLWEESTTHQTFLSSKTQVRMESRADQLRTACQGNPQHNNNNNNNNKDKEARSNTMVLEDYQTSVCVVLKAGASSLTYLVAHLIDDTAIIRSRKWYQLIGKLRAEPEAFREIINSTKYTRVLMARDPLHRLLSAYTNRIANPSTYTAQAKHYGPLILKKIRKVNLTTTQLFHRDGTLKVTPTFREFVQFLVSVPSTQYDPHWKPIYLQCSLCQVDYTDVVHLETFIEDMEYLLEKTGMDRRVDKKLLTENTNPSPNNTTRILVDYYSTLGPKLLSQIVAVYKYDFLYLGYDPTPLLNQIS